MLARLENYIIAVTDYLKANYPGVVVSWDVVNEAVDDSTGKLRDSNWLKVVGDDFINRAFEIARRHVPAGTLLYYNDYNSSYQPKLDGIVSVITSVQAEGNIDGYGFQMHHSVGSPSIQQIDTALKTVAATGLKMRVSELDIGVSDTSDHSFYLQALKYADIMALLKPYAGQLTAVQVWGITDDLSWRAREYPLLFDAKAQPKSAFWALIDPEMIPPEPKSGVTYGPVDDPDDWDSASILRGDGFVAESRFTSDGLLQTRVTVKDAVPDHEDAITVFSSDRSVTVQRGEISSTEITDGYQAVLTLPLGSIVPGDQVPFDILVINGTKRSGWSSTDAGAEHTSGTLTAAAVVPTARAPYGKARFDPEYAIPIQASRSKNPTENGTWSAVAYASWDEEALYVRVNVTDSHLDASGASPYMHDSVEIFLDELDNRTSAYGADDHHYRVNFKGRMSTEAGNSAWTAVSQLTETGFTAEFTIPFTQRVDRVVGFDVRVNNAGRDMLRRLVNFADITDRGKSDPRQFGRLLLLPK